MNNESWVSAVQLNLAYIDGQIAWLKTNLASSNATYNIVVVRPTNKTIVVT